MNVFNLQSFESLASCFQSLLFVSAIGSIVVSMAIAFHLAASKWISATWLYVFWFVVLLRFVLFVVPESPTSLLNLTAQPATEISLIEQDVQGIGEDEQLIFSSEANVPIPIDEATTSFRLSALNCWMFAAIVWLIVAVGLMFRLGLGYLAVKRLIGESSQPSSELAARFESLKRRLRLRQRTRLRVSNEIDVPAMAGLFRPVVILPEWCFRELDHEQLEMVFTHELIHIQRRDGLIQLVAHLIVVLHWFNPLARIAASFIESTRELSCDRRVIEIWRKTKRGRAKAGSNTENLLIERKYGRTILDIAGRAHSMESANNASQFSVAFLSGFVGSNQNLIKQRIAMLVNSRSQLWLRNIVAAGFIALLLAVGFTSAQTICPPVPPAVVQVLPQVTEAIPIAPQPIGPAIPEFPMYSIPMAQLQLPVPETLFPNPPARDLPIDGAVFDTPVAEVAKPNPYSKPILLNAGQVKRLSFDHQIPEIMVEDPAILIATPVSPDEIQFTAVAPGTTEVHVFDPNRKMQILRFRIVPDVRDLKSKVEKEFPGAEVFVRGTTDGFVNLYGQVTTEQIAKINEFVVANCSLPIRNQLSDTPPIAIKVKIYEVSTTKLKQLGIDWSKGGMDMPAKIETMRSLLPQKNGVSHAENTFAFDLLEVNQFDEFLMTLERHNVAKLLDQPILVAQHGHAAEFMSGGEVPFATLNEKGQPIVEFRFYGTKIQTTPHIHSKDEMTLEIRAEVTEIAKDLSTSDGVPGFRVRRLNTGMRMKPKQTIAMIGDYRSGEKGDKDSTELVFLMTPRFIDAKEKPAVDVEQFSKGPEFKLHREAAAQEESSNESDKRR